ncbi:hypothetical protein DITRI_Ditri06bG0145300 [Diplodiscus trichospermus]
MIDGWHIFVKKAKFGWKERTRKKESSMKVTEPKMDRQKSYYNERDHRTYKDVVVGVQMKNANIGQITVFKRARPSRSSKEKEAKEKEIYSDEAEHR